MKYRTGHLPSIVDAAARFRSWPRLESWLDKEFRSLIGDDQQMDGDGDRQPETIAVAAGTVSRHPTEQRH